MPGVRQGVLLVGIAAAVAIGIAVVLWSRGPSFSMLYANLDEKDAAQVVQALQTANVTYQLGNGGSSIYVQAADASQIRLKLAAQGLPHGGSEANGMGGGETPFGMSELAEKTRYQQILENDLASTIASLQSVKAARVHLALPKASAFIRDRRPASASVVVTLYPGRQLDASQVGAIAHLVASSTPDLDSRQVSIIDQKGQLLTTTDPDSDAAISDTRFRLVQRIETSYASRIEELLTPLVGPGRVRAQVMALMDFTENEKTSETYNNEKPLVRSEQVSHEQHADGHPTEGGVPGALSNQPPAPGTQPTAANPAGKTTQQSADTTSSSSNETRNYELDRTISHTRDPIGTIRRLTVAVAVDNKSSVDEDGKTISTAFTKAELDQMNELVKNAVGFDTNRGDNVSVVNAPFQNEPVAEPVNQPMWQQPMMREFIKQGLGALLVLGLMFGVLRPLFRGLIQNSARETELLALPGGLARADRLTLGSDGNSAAMDYDQKVALAKRMVGQDPKQVAQVVKSWVVEDAG